MVIEVILASAAGFGLYAAYKALKPKAAAVVAEAKADVAKVDNTVSAVVTEVKSEV